jgi:hypothetical protein
VAADRTAPHARVYVEDRDVTEDLGDWVQSIVWEEGTELTTQLTLIVANHRGRFTDNVIFNPGNEVEVHIGYGGKTNFLGRAEIIRQEVDFGNSDVPTIKVTARDRGWRMMKQQLALTQSGKTPEKRGDEPSNTSEGPIPQLLEKILSKYSIRLDIDPAYSDIEDTFIQKKGQTDMQIVRALANFYDAVFWIEYRPGTALRGSSPGVRGKSSEGAWYAVFTSVFNVSRQKKKHVFRYYDLVADLTDINFKYEIDTMVSEIQAYVWDPQAVGPEGRRGGWRIISEESTEKGEDPFFRRSRRFNAKIASGPEATKVKIAAAGHSIQVLTKPFKNIEEARTFVKTWFERNKDLFISADGTLPGVLIRAGDVHELDSDYFGVRYRGDYYFSTVGHTYKSDGWTTTFTARRAIR